MKKCKWDGKELPEGSTIDFCNQECAKQFKEKIESEKKSNKSKDENKQESVNEGTANKFLIQSQALSCFKNYPQDQTAKQYSSLLCWDIGVSRRTALENYIEPMIAHNIIVPSGNNRYRLNPKYEENG